MSDMSDWVVISNLIIYKFMSKWLIWKNTKYILIIPIIYIFLLSFLLCQYLKLFISTIFKNDLKALTSYYLNNKMNKCPMCRASLNNSYSVKCNLLKEFVENTDKI